MNSFFGSVLGFVLVLFNVIINLIFFSGIFYGIYFLLFFVFLVYLIGGIGISVLLGKVRVFFNDYFFLFVYECFFILI